jgi:RHH-type proline utilization regulon transcriptional repressor/proline dehydrogenase/delta 1-pyrroline-5-carboxylate dehydrogenase
MAARDPAPSAPFHDFAASQRPQPALRAAIGAHYREAEAACVQRLAAAATLPAEDAGQARLTATALVEGLRAKPAAGIAQGLIRAYDLSGPEGTALMCLAEALLRIPDAATRDALIRDKIGSGDWRPRPGRPVAVNAATLGLALAAGLTGTGPMARAAAPLIRFGVERAMRMMGGQFVTGQTIEAALRNARRLENSGFRYSYDMLGEAAATAEDAARYYRDYEHAIRAIGKASAATGVHDAPGISVKLSALHPRYTWLQRERVMSELLPRLLALATLARTRNIALNIDAEEADRLELSLDLLETLCGEPALSGWDGIGFVVQAYQKRAPYVLDWIIDLARRSGHRLMVRLVKGAYWDTEIKRAQVDGLEDFPVFTRKVHTDISYLACARRLLAAPDAVFPQFATHNAHTVATIHRMAGGAFSPGQYEFQCLHGMGEPLYRQVLDGLKRPCRIYAPVGTYETLLAYLVRRLLENGANSSFVNRIHDPSVPVSELVADPVARAGDGPNPGIALPGELFAPERRNSIGLDLSDPRRLAALAAALTESAVQPWLAEPGSYQDQDPGGAWHSPHPSWPGLSGPPIAACAATDGPDKPGHDDERTTPGSGSFPSAPYPASCADTPGHDAEGSAAPAREVRNPADQRDIAGYVREATPADVDAALAIAGDAASRWRDTPPNERAACLLRAADTLEARMDALIGLIVREAGKSFANAAGELREAVDFLRYYAGEVSRTFDNATHRALGPIACISPWNFPLSIFTGQVAAALAAGNPVLAKPAEETPLIAARAVAALHEAGVPRDALLLLPGDGEVGARLVADGRVRGVVFTGSTEVARLIQRQLAARLNPDGSPVPLIAETGGRNAMIVDSSALAEQVVADVLQSAFDSAGQRCSALRLLCLQEDVAHRLLGLLKGALAELAAGNPDRLSTDIGPVISAAAREDINAYINAMREAGHPVYQAPLPAACAQGTFVAPTIIELDDASQLTREVFGPVLHVTRFPRSRMDAVVDAVNATGYALTFGLHSRIDETIARVTARSRAGNIYINRTIIGAVVGVQPFGGHGMSGTGPKAGGPLYLSRLLASRPARCGLPPGKADAAGRLWAEVLRQWGETEAADRVAAMPAVAGVRQELTGPVGETNLYSTVPCGTVLCHSLRPSALLQQIGAALVTGNNALVQAGSLPRLPAELSGRVRETPRPMECRFDAALFDGDREALLAFTEAVAAKAGPIIPVHVALADGSYPLEALVRERCISTNTTAAGGNARLMTIG